MPYGGDTPEETKKIEACVLDLLSKPDFRKGQKDETRKTSAIAICKASIMKKEETKPVEVKENVKRDEDGKIIVKENVQLVFNAVIRVKEDDK